MLKADLHIHSNISDGSDSMENIVEKAIMKDLDVIVFTEHDTLEHKNKLPKSDYIKILAGIEISAFDYGKMKKAHILGYGIEDIQKVEKFTNNTLVKRHENSLRQIKKLEDNGFEINVEKINKANGKYIYKQHIMEYLFNTGQVNHKFGDFYKSVFKNGGICDFDIEYVNAIDAVRIITEAGGKAVLAHSGQQKNFYLIDELVKVGLKGIEYNHLANSKEDKIIIRKYANKYNLFLTGGSDYHGRNDKEKNWIGRYLSEESGINAIS
jgi:predicted metal-dependent phosphoesterase TrpH